MLESWQQMLSKNIRIIVIRAIDFVLRGGGLFVIPLCFLKGVKKADYRARRGRLPDLFVFLRSGFKANAALASSAPCFRGFKVNL